MKVCTFHDVERFARDAGPFVDADPFSTSVIAVQVEGILRGDRPQGPEDQWWTVVDNDRAVGVAMHTPPHKVFLARMPPAAAAALAETLAGAGHAVPGVTGEIGAVASFADAWKRCTGVHSTVAVAMRMYRLSELVTPTGVPGGPRPADTTDVEVVAAWLGAFHDEAQPHAPIVDWTSLALRRVTSGQFCLWDLDGATVSMAGFSEPAAGVSRVGPVYTPPVWRGRGFGSAVTAAATAAALGARAGQVVLYTDLSNPTSNAIYQDIGYRVDHDAEERTFVP